jgi:hypothetical protein
LRFEKRRSVVRDRIAKWVALCWFVLPPCLVLIGIAVLCAGQANPARPEVPAAVWAKVQPHLDSLDRQAAAARVRRLADLRAFFREREKGAAGFAEEALSWGGKWALIQQMMHIGEADAHRRQLADAFGRHLFTGADLQAEMERVVRGHLSDLEGLENDMLVQIRADLADGDLGRGKRPASLDSDAAFRAECRRLEADLLPTLSRELGVTAGREVVSFVAMDVATQVVLRVAEAVAGELGISAGVLGTGAASTVETLGVGLVVGFVIDALIGKVMRAFGHDPEEEIRRQAVGLVERLADLIIDGDPAARQAHDRLLHMAADDWYPPARDAARLAAQSIEKGGRLGLGWELGEQDRLRSRLRTEALRKLFSEGGAP